MKIVFFGSSEFSVPVLQALISSDDEVVQVVTTPDKPKGRGQKIAPSIVKSFTEKNHRLPNMPSAKEIEKNGAELGEIQRLTVEKVEELFKYLDRNEDD